MSSAPASSAPAASAPAASYVAIDLGAGSGRVVRGELRDEQLVLEVVHRFANAPRQLCGCERWDARGLLAEIVVGLQRCGRGVRSLGVDTWGVDYGLFDAGGALLEDPVCYRDRRTDTAVERVLVRVSRAELFARTGLQVQQFNTIYQLFAHRHGGGWPTAAARLLMMPDVFHALLCGSEVSELTAASTSQLLRAGTGAWDVELLERLGLPTEVMPPLVPPGTALGRLRPALQREHGLAALAVVAPAAHDTASAVAGTPLRPGWGYISSGTWSLVGVETEAPLLTPEVMAHNLTNEGGVAGTNRLLRNVMGLWILESCRRQWARRGAVLGYGELEARLAAAPAFAGFIDPDAPRFFRPRDMLAEVRAALRETGQPVPDAGDQVALTRIVLESLAMRYASALRALAQVLGRPVRGVHILGGGSQNAFLNQATADATGLEVWAGPTEATALGNIAVQAIADRRFADLAQARAYVAERLPPRRFAPRDVEAWRAALPRYLAVEGSP